MHKEYPCPRIVISECLGFASCRYNGQTIPDNFIDKLKKYVDFLPICPEVEIGLGIPRDPIRIAEVDGAAILYQPASGKDLTDKMIRFVDKYLTDLTEIDGFILKNRSPSCGPGDVKIYIGLEKSAMTRRGSGFFGGAVFERFPQAAIEDEGRLKNFQLREHFLIKLFTMARFRATAASGKMSELVKFHSRHKLLFLAYNESHYRLSGRIVANHEKHALKRVLTEYLSELTTILSKPARYTGMINTLLHAFGGISDQLSSEEKKFFLNTIEEYRDERVPLSTLFHLLNAYAIRFDSQYLQSQIFLNPYPRELTEITDSGKGRNY